MAAVAKKVVKNNNKLINRLRFSVKFDKILMHYYKEGGIICRN